MAASWDAEKIWGSTFWSALVALRREIHMFPEPGFEEVRTQERIKEILAGVGKIPADQIQTCAITGLLVDIKGTADPKPEALVHCIALRADLDALTMAEQNTLPYRSKNEGVAHMCGHDGHLTALVGTAILLQRRVAEIPSNCKVRLFFQPAEETTPPGTGGYDYDKTAGGGAVPMIWEGCLDGVDEVYAWHNWPAWPLGELRVSAGAVMAHESYFEITIRGCGGHGSQPHATIDPVVCGAMLVTSLQTLVSRTVPSNANAVVSVCQFHSGERNNVIPDTAVLSGTIRDVDEAVCATIHRRLIELTNGVCKAHGCQVDIDIKNGCPVLSNAEAPTDAVLRCATRLREPIALKTSPDGLPLLGGEDFSYFAKQRPSCYFFMGTRELLTSGLAVFGDSDGKPRSNCGCHNSAFDFNDNVLPYAVSMMVRIVEDRFGLELYKQDDILEASMQS